MPHLRIRPPKKTKNFQQLQLEDGRQILTNQIAGALARRVLNYLKIGQIVETGEEMGFIRLGSRVDIYLPTDTQLSVKIGDSVKGRETVIGTITDSVNK